MMSENLRAQQYSISERAWDILQNQWRNDALKPDSSGSSKVSVNPINSSSETKEQYDSKFEGDYYRLKEMESNSDRRNALNKIAVAAENKAEIEREYGYNDEHYEDEQRGWSLGM